MPKRKAKSFVEWLKAKEMPVVLFAHNAKSFDCKRIIYLSRNVIF